ncbi:pyruvate/2-oxoglutarate dehydrogenase complex, dihydrolipoamide acyltransferase (E2) component [Rhodobacter sp. TJ_12]|uniref:DUF3035 domain-containing protein n=1 Tax=Rhodobacter sp. TJ_12 TaxID=2029399 RepID=UPI001CBDCC55|nr:DUF3035 domain-containing protein [Rhodobacter sp. TJ_12]MBZ4020973.1 pyruvate/2-oxoglutarate dehydrogenase complex, dihydrolipoamide acyltransferase (E2) component [Rhodobacter sp. TJ_12]
MRSVTNTLGIALVMALALAGCSRSDKTPELMHLRSSTAGPDEFGILPTKPLEMPEDLAQLPDPTPGGTNITDPTPEADAVAALGGNPERLKPNGVPRGDGALLARAGRFGTGADIRDRLAEEDLQYRRDHDGRLLERLFNVTVYYKAYRPMSLDKAAELERWRKAGARTPAAPPSGLAQDVLP